MSLLFLGHALLGGTALLFVHASREIRSRVVMAVAGAGVLLGLILVLTDGTDWRTMSLQRPGAAIAGVAVAAAWVVVAALDLGRGHVEHAVFAGVAGSGLVGFSLNDWVVPALLFWGCSSFALLLLVRREHGRGLVLASVGLSDLLLIAGLSLDASTTEAWALPGALDGLPFALVATAAVIRSGAVPALGGWGLLGSPTAAALPLMTGGSFAMLEATAGRSQPWLAVVMLAAGLATSAVTILRESPWMSAIGAWPVSLSMGATLLAPAAGAGASVAAVLAVAAVAVWPYASTGGRRSRGLLLAFAPATAGFGVIALALSRAFDRSRGSGTEDSLAWTLAAALLPVALAAGVVLAMRVGSLGAPWGYEPTAVVATWVFVGASVLVGVIAAGSLGVDAEPLGPHGRVLALDAIALVIGVLAARSGLAARAGAAASHSDEHFVIGVTTGPPPRLMGYIATALWIGAAAILFYLTIAGLKVGFL